MSSGRPKWVSQSLGQAVGDAALEASQGVLLRPALSLLAQGVGAALRVVRDLGPGDEVDDAVELPVTPTVQPMAVRPARAGGQGRSVCGGTSTSPRTRSAASAGSWTSR